MLKEGKEFKIKPQESERRIIHSDTHPIDKMQSVSVGRVALKYGVVGFYGLGNCSFFGHTVQLVRILAP